MGKLYIFLESNKEVAATTAAAELARKATETLGFQVQASTVANLRQQMGIKCSAGRPKSNNGEDVAELRREISVIADCLANLYHALRFAPPAEITAIADRKNIRP